MSLNPARITSLRQESETQAYIFGRDVAGLFGDLSEIAVILVNKIGGGLVDEVGGLPAKLSTCW